MTDAEYLRAWREKHPEKVQEYRRRYAALNYFAKLRYEEKLRTDAEFYANTRAKRRERQRKYYDKTRTREYRPCLSKRRPDWCVKGQEVLDHGSKYLIVNRTAEMLAYVRELSRERRERK